MSFTEPELYFADSLQGAQIKLNKLSHLAVFCIKQHASDFLPRKVY